MNENEKLKTPTPEQNNVPQNQKKHTRLKSSSISIDELESLNEQNIKLYHQRNRRNRIIITTLTILLILSITGMIVFGIILQQNLNCFMHVKGDVKAVYYVDNKQIDEFRTPNGMRGNCILQFDLKIKIESDGNYNVTIDVVAYENDVVLDNLLIYEPNKALFKKVSGSKYQSIAPISGNQTIWLCKGVIIDKKYEKTLNVDNFKLDFTTEFIKV